MSTMTLPNVFDTDVDHRDPLAAAAAAVTSATAHDAVAAPFVVIVRPDADDHQVFAEGPGSVLRAAVSVAVAAGNDRLWADAAGDGTVEVNLHRFPEVIRAAANGAGVTAAQVGVVRTGGEIACVGLWFETVGRIVRRHEIDATLQVLEAAAQRSASARAAALARRASDDAASVAAAAALPARAELATRAELEQQLADFESDSAALVAVAIDGFDELDDAFGVETSERVAAVVAQRLAGSCRRTDVVADLGGGWFAIFLVDVDRSTAIQIGKRLPALLAAPLPDEIGPATITATVAVSHEDGLVDAEEMFESAELALRSAQRAGTGRMVLAA